MTTKRRRRVQPTPFAPRPLERHQGGRPTVPITLVMRGEQGGLQRHATQRLKPDDRDMHVIDRMGASGELDSRLYANACALLDLWSQTAIQSSAVSNYEPRIANSSGDADVSDHEVTWHTAMSRLHRHYQYLLGNLVRGGHPGAFLPNVRTALDYLDYLTADYDGGMWHGDE